MNPTLYLKFGQYTKQQTLQPLCTLKEGPNNDTLCTVHTALAANSLYFLITLLLHARAVASIGICNLQLTRLILVVGLLCQGGRYSSHTTLRTLCDPA